MPAYNTDRISNRLEDFSRIKTKYCNEYYQDFHSSYIYKTSDLYFLKSKLNTYYERIYNSYEKIYAYWRTFLDDICNIDASIAGKPAGNISDSTVSSLIRNLPTLPEYNNNVQTLFGSAYASAHGSAHQSAEWLKWAKENPEEAQDLILSTSAVVVGSIISGTAKVGEHIVESFIWVGGALAEGAIWLGYFFSDMTNEDRDFMLNDIKESTMDTIAEDWVGQGQQYFYENTGIGRDINAKSAIKYDSETAQIIQGVSEQVSVKLLEVAANLIPGGGPVISGIIGATYAAGSKAEEKFSDVENRNFWADSAIIAVNGVVGYADGYMTGKMTQTAVSGIKNIKAANSIKETLKQVGNSKVTKDGVQKLLKRTTIETFKEFDFYTDALGASADTIESAVEAKEWTLNDTMAIVSNVGVSYFTNFLGNLGGNMFEDAMMGVDIDKMHSSPSAKSDTSVKVSELEVSELQSSKPNVQEVAPGAKKEADALVEEIRKRNISGFESTKSPEQIKAIQEIYSKPSPSGKQDLSQIENPFSVDKAKNLTSEEKVLRFAGSDGKIKEVEISQLRGTKPNVQEVAPGAKKEADALVDKSSHDLNLNKIYSENPEMFSRQGMSYEQYAAQNGIKIKDYSDEMDLAVDIGDENWYLVQVLINNEQKMSPDQFQAAASAIQKPRSELDTDELMKVAGPFLTKKDMINLSEIKKHPNMGNLSFQNKNTLSQFQAAGGCDINLILRGGSSCGSTLDSFYDLEMAMNGAPQNIWHSRNISKKVSIVDEIDDIIRNNANTSTIKGVSYFDTVGPNVPTGQVLDIIEQYGADSPEALQAVQSLIGLDMTDSAFNSKTIPPTRETNYSHRFNSLKRGDPGNLSIKVESYISPGCGAYIDTYGGIQCGLGEMLVKRNCSQKIIDAYIDPNTSKLVLVTLYT